MRVLLVLALVVLVVVRLVLLDRLLDVGRGGGAGVGLRRGGLLGGGALRGLARRGLLRGLARRGLLRGLARGGLLRRLLRRGGSGGGRVVVDDLTVDNVVGGNVGGVGRSGVLGAQGAQQLLGDVGGLVHQDLHALGHLLLVQAAQELVAGVLERLHGITGHALEGLGQLRAGGATEGQQAEQAGLILVLARTILAA